MKTIPRGIHSSRQHEPLDHSPPVAQRTGALSNPILGDFDPPTSPAMIEVEREILKILVRRPTNIVAAHRILKIDRIARALAVLEFMEVSPFPVRPESSDAR